MPVSDLLRKMNHFEEQGEMKRVLSSQRWQDEFGESRLNCRRAFSALPLERRTDLLKRGYLRQKAQPSTSLMMKLILPIVLAQLAALLLPCGS